MEMLEFFGARIAGVVGGQYSLTAALDPLGGPAITHGQLPDQFPVGVAMMPYQVSADAYQAEDVEGLQLRYRGTFDQVMGLRQEVFDDLQGLHGVTVSTTLVIEQVSRQSSTSLGYDANNRLNWTDNYYVQNWSPSTQRL